MYAYACVGVELKGLMIEIKSRKRENCLVLIELSNLTGLKLSSICAYVFGQKHHVPPTKQHLPLHAS